jgi:competence protein ComEA
MAPGVFRLPAGSRIADALAAAGLLASADLSSLNCSAKLVDEQVIVIPAKSEKSETVPEADPDASVCVDIKGAVEQPGMVCLLPGSRLEDAVQAAGGVLADADLSAVNLAKLLTDEMLIVIPRKSTTSTPEITVPSYFYVSVHGEVVRPGLFYVSNTTTIGEVINLTGGVSLNGSTLNLKMDQVVTSGQDIVVLTVAQALAAMPEEDEEEPIESGETDAKVNINTANGSELETLNGIGAVLAQAIIDYRAENGLFSTVEDIMLVSGIKSSVYAEIKDDIVV